MTYYWRLGEKVKITYYLQKATEPDLIEINKTVWLKLTSIYPKPFKAIDDSGKEYHIQNRGCNRWILTDNENNEFEIDTDKTFSHDMLMFYSRRDRQKKNLSSVDIKNNYNTLTSN